MRKAGSVAVVMAWLLVMGSGVAQAASGDLDDTFSGDGRATALVAGKSTDGWDLAVQDDGKVVIVGTVRMNATDWDFALARYKPNGTLDPTFGNGDDGTVRTGWTAGDDEAYAVELLPSGRILVAGQAGNDVAIARYTTTGHLDSTFGGGDGKVVINITPGQDAAWDIELLDDGKFLLGGDAGDDFVVMKFGPKGGLTGSFGGGDGFGTLHSHNGSLEGRELAVQPDGKILLTGFVFAFPNFAMALARFGTNGQPDDPFGSHGLSIALETQDAEGWGIKPLTGGKVLVVGYARNGNQEDSPYDAAFVRFTKQGQVDPTYAGGQEAKFADLGGAIDYVFAMATLPSGKLVLAGSSSDAGLSSDGVVAKATANGTLVSSFGESGVAEAGFVSNGAQFWGVGVTPSNKVVASGYVGFESNPDKFATARFLG
jgi:uncharacterized delta-60 repeat protein